MGESHQNLAIPLLLQHNDFVIAYKANGVDCHDCDGNSGLFNRMSQQLGQQIYPVHRLDKVTSGLIIMATNSEAAARFERLFRLRNIEKCYLALALGKPNKKQGWIKGDMEKSRRGAWKLLRSQNNPAVTYFHSNGFGDGLRGYCLQPKSGKTHQIRVAMKSLGTPILGDMLYGDTQQMQVYDRTYLHAFALRFDWNGQTICQIAEPQTGAQFQQLPVKTWIESVAEQFGCN